MAKNERPIVIKVDHVHKNFRLPHEKVTTLKSAVLQLVSGGGRSMETQHALKDISFEVEQGEFFGIVGRNGSGKSTLLKILAGIYRPNQGWVQTDGRLVPFIELGVGFNGELTGRENVYLNGALLGFSKQEVAAMYADIVAFAELENFMDQKLKNYSSGMQVRLAFSLATRSRADILLVDEVLAVGDASFQRKCFDYFRQLKKSGVTVIFVTHDMDAVREYCDRAILIDHSELVASGSAEEMAEAYTKLFNPGSSEDADTQVHKHDRWGDESLTYSQPTVTFDKAGKHITINTSILASREVDSPVFGFIVKAADGKAVLGTNTITKKHRIAKLKDGQRVSLSWALPCILADGKYTITVAAHDTSGSQVYDWFEDAVSFSVYSDEKVPYDVNPDITVNISIAG